MAQDIAAKIVIPCHYDMFQFNTASPDEFTKECLLLASRATFCAAARGGPKNDLFLTSKSRLLDLRRSPSAQSHSIFVFYFTLAFVG